MKKRIEDVLFYAFIAVGVFTVALCIYTAGENPAVPASGSGGNWGLSFPNPGKPPVGNASPDYLARYDARFIGSADGGDIYLTFDAGYENGYTPAILDMLRKNRVPAAFFLVGAYIRDNPDLVKRMAAEGHLVCNHTMTHPDMSAIESPEAFRTELSGTETLYREAVGADMPKYYRPPRGVYSEENLKMAKELGYTTFFWSLAYVDWYVDRQPTREQAMQKLLPRIHPGAVILLHNTSKTNAEILDELIKKYRDMGYEFKSLDELAVKTENS